jgi:hypothetical protein
MQVFLQCRARPDLSPVSTSAPRVPPPNQTIHSLCCYDNSTDTVGWFFLCFTYTGAAGGKKSMVCRGRRSRETVCVEDETACRCKKSRKQAENVLRLFIVQVTANSASHKAKDLYFEISYRVENYWPVERLRAYPRQALLSSAKMNTKISPWGWKVGSWTNSRC